MNPSRVFRLTLTRRILEVSGALAVIAPVAASACSSEVIFDDDEGTSASSGNGGSSTTNTTTGISTTTTTGITTTTTTSGVGGSTPWCCDCGQMQTVCIAPQGGCPSSLEALSFMQDTCLETCLDLAWVESGPVEQNGQCCYQVSVGCIGRPFVVDQIGR